jgi:hypothetical protein
VALARRADQHASGEQILAVRPLGHARALCGQRLEVARPSIGAAGVDSCGQFRIDDAKGLIDRTLDPRLLRLRQLGHLAFIATRQFASILAGRAAPDDFAAIEGAIQHLTDRRL